MVLSPVMPVMVAVPSLLAVACAVSHVAPRTPVIVRNARTVLARTISHTTILAAAAGVLVVGEALNDAATLGPSMRNLLLLTGLALLTGGLAGVTYAWVPVLVLFGAGVLSSPDESTWSLYALVIAPTSEPVQLIAAGFLCAAALGIAAWDPLDRAYLQVVRPGQASTSVER